MPPEKKRMPAGKASRVRPIFPIIGISAAVLLVAIAAAVALFGTPAQVQSAASIGGPFQLEDAAGKPITDQAFRGKFMLVYFGYTYCPDVCPTTLNDVSQALDILGPKADALKPVFITVDPARDTPAIIGQYAAAFSPRLEGLTGTPAEIAAVAKEYRVYYQKHQTGPGPGDYTMDHSSILYVMNPDGHFLGVIRADETPDQMAADLSKFMS